MQSIHTNAAMENSKLDEYIREAASLGIVFMQKAIRYYQQPSWKRVLESLTKPPGIFDDLVVKISEAISEIAKECSTLNKKSVAAIRQMTEENRVDVRTLGADVKALAERVSNQDNRTRNEKLQKYRDMLRTKHKEQSLELDQYQEQLNIAFKNLRKRTDFNFERLQEASKYESWLHSQR